jgi:hypothetical protein
MVPLHLNLNMACRMALEGCAQQINLIHRLCLIFSTKREILKRVSGDDHVELFDFFARCDTRNSYELGRARRGCQKLGGYRPTSKEASLIRNERFLTSFSAGIFDVKWRSAPESGLKNRLKRVTDSKRFTAQVKLTLNSLVFVRERSESGV